MVNEDTRANMGRRVNINLEELIDLSALSCMCVSIKDATRVLPPALPPSLGTNQPGSARRRLRCLYPSSTASALPDAPAEPVYIYIYTSTCIFR